MIRNPLNKQAFQLSADELPSEMLVHTGMPFPLELTG